MLANIQSIHQFQRPYRVLSARGYTLGKFARCDEALRALRDWAQAVAVIHADRVIARKERNPRPADATPPARRRAS